MFRFAIAFIALVFWASTAFAAPDDPFGKALLARIKSEGFRVQSIKTTLLRRIQIDSQTTSKRRQTVYNPVTGEVLRDAIFGIGESGFLAHVSEVLGVDVRSHRSGRGGKNGENNGKNGKDNGKNGKDNGKNGKNNGKSDSKGNSGNGNSANGKSN